MKPHPEILPWFVGTWIVLGVLSIWFYFIDRNIQRKKRIFPILNIGGGILFIVFTLFMMGQPMILIIAVPGVALITFLNIRNIKICESCGRTVYNNTWFSKMEFCSKCGAKLT